jgi:hypothetical protein
MFRGKDAQLWWHTSSVIANLLNCHIDTKKKPRGISPGEVHPYEKHAAAKSFTINRDSMGTFAAMCGVSPEKAKQDEARAQARKQAADQMAARMRQRMVLQCN